MTVSASLAQIGEFSFILAGLGVSMGLLPGEGRDLILAGALFSITLNPLVFAAVDKVLAKLRPGTYGEKRLAGLQAQLSASRRRVEARDAEHSLQIQNLVDLFPIFADLDHQAREDLLMLFRPRSATPGQRVIRKGDRPDAAYFISKGTVQVSVGDRLIPLGPGDFFGEMALLSGARRSADVTATDYCQFLTLDQREFRSFVARNPRLREQLDALAAQRSAMNRDRPEPAPVPTI